MVKFFDLGFLRNKRNSDKSSSIIQSEERKLKEDIGEKIYKYKQSGEKLLAELKNSKTITIADFRTSINQAKDSCRKEMIELILPVARRVVLTLVEEYIKNNNIIDEITQKFYDEVSEVVHSGALTTAPVPTA